MRRRVIGAARMPTENKPTEKASDAAPDKTALTLWEQAILASKELDAQRAQDEKDRAAREFEQKRTGLQSWLNRWLPKTTAGRVMVFDPDKPGRVKIDGVTIHFSESVSIGSYNPRAYVVEPCKVRGCEGEVWYSLDGWHTLASLGDVLSGQRTPEPCGTCIARKEAELGDIPASPTPAPTWESDGEKLEQLIKSIAGEMVQRHLEAYHASEI